MISMCGVLASKVLCFDLVSLLNMNIYCTLHPYIISLSVEKLGSCSRFYSKNIISTFFPHQREYIERESAPIYSSWLDKNLGKQVILLSFSYSDWCLDVNVLIRYVTFIYSLYS